MQAVVFPGYGRTEIVELPRPALQGRGDAIVLVTTAAIGPWDIDRFLGQNANGATENGATENGATENGAIPGGEFAGIVVETGEDVSLIELDDLVANTVQRVAVAKTGPANRSSKDKTALFGSDALPGGHAEYVRVPNADTTLIKIAASGEERAVLAGGTAGLGVGVAAMAVAASPQGTYTVVGCDPIGMTALVALKNGGAGVKDRMFAIEGHSARRTLASSYASAVFENTEESGQHQSDVVIVGAVRHCPGFEAVIRSVRPGGHIIFAEPYGASRILEPGNKFPEGVTVTAAKWPNVGDAKRIVTDLQIRRIDLTPIVSHVMPLDEVQDAYEAAAGPGAGVQGVLLKM
jgi:threonine dehydrogenase-like Zn-dependent dehydrogenase